MTSSSRPRGHAGRAALGWLLLALCAPAVADAPPLDIVAHPADSARCGGEAYRFTIRAEGGQGTRHYRWQKDGVTLPGAVEPAHTIRSLTPEDAGTYVCVVTDDGRSVARSRPAKLAVLAVTSQPRDAVCRPGQAHTFTAAASNGDGTPVTYQWYKDGHLLAGDTAPVLVRHPARPRDTGAYRCRIRQQDNATWSARAVLQVTARPIRFDAHPRSQAAYVGEAVTLAVAAHGGVAALEYQWRRAGTAIAGATAERYAIESVSLDDAGVYECLVSDASKRVPSQPAVLEVALFPSLTAHPEGAQRYVGEAHTFSVAATGGQGRRHYQWLSDAPAAKPRARTAAPASGLAPLPGATDPRFTLNPLSIRDSGTYLCTVTDDAGFCVASGRARLDVSWPLEILSHPRDAVAIEGTSALLSTSAAGGHGETRYQWQKDGEAIDGATDATLVLDAVTSDHQGTYTCVVTDATGTRLVSNEARLSVTARLAIVAQPVGATRWVGGRHTLAVEATGGLPPLAYRWRRNGIAVAEADAAEWTLDPLALAHAGVYTCLVADAAGAKVVTREAVLVVRPPLSVTAQPQGGHYAPGQAHTFAVGVSGGVGPLAYQWFRDGDPIPGATRARFTIDPLAPGHAGEYACLVHDAIGDVTTAPAPLAVEALEEGPAVQDAL